MDIERDTMGYPLKTLITEDAPDARRKGRYTV